MACELVATCPFFNEQTDAKPTILALYRARYCRGQSSECARYLIFVAMGREHVPRNLYPSDQLRALALVREAHFATHNPQHDAGERAEEYSPGNSRIA